MQKQSGLKIFVKGIVQGVGFRPFVYGLAKEHQLTGRVCNSSKGVEIELEGQSQALENFLSSLKTSPPPLAKIDLLESESYEACGFRDFQIIPSQPEEGEYIPISPDVSICADCHKELFNPHDRRYRYPFINCTNCGPRFTIIKDIPYDRPKTSMAGFELCEACKSEYENPLDRRFHAQPVACPDCGPKIWFESNGEQIAFEEDALQSARNWLKEGKILAVKGLGGFHLACDAANHMAVSKLRERKRRSQKPFAVMAFNTELVKKYCTLTQEEQDVLESNQRPIVLLRKKEDSLIAEETAPNQTSLGVMLPYTPLHLLLLEPEENFPEILVMTSGNSSEEPIAYQDQDIYPKLETLADGFLLHDRPIHIRTDDSVVRIFDKKPYFSRRARGFAPDPLRLTEEMPQILAVGAELKNTFCLTRDKYAFLSHHIGDLENYETLSSFESGIKHFQNLFRIKPEFLAADLHPDYLSTRYALEKAESEALPLIQIQHHHAHLAACLADNKYQDDQPVIGLIFDGTGLGSDKHIWGGEILVGDYTSFNRAYHLAYSPLPGGDLAVKKPARLALAQMQIAGLEWSSSHPSASALSPQEVAILETQIKKGINCPQTSSMGRLFDAVSAMIGIRQIISYEGQAAIELESIIDQEESGFYHFCIDQKNINFTPMIKEIYKDWRSGISNNTISARFHNSIVEMVREVCNQIRSKQNIHKVALSGGAWQNMYLLNKTVETLRTEGFEVMTHKNVPTNDGGISLGQAVIAAKHFINRKGA